MCLQSPRRALIDGLSAWMCQTGKINYRSPKQYLYWLSWLEFAFVRKISCPLSITNKQTWCILLIFFSLKVKTFKLWNILTIKEGPMLVLTLIKCLSPLSGWISFICIFGLVFFFWSLLWLSACYWNTTLPDFSENDGTEEHAQAATHIYSG